MMPVLDGFYLGIIAHCYAVVKIYMELKCDNVNVAWGKNYREESDKVFAIGYQVDKKVKSSLPLFHINDS